MSERREPRAHVPEHGVQPLDPKSPDAANLTRLGERFHADVERQFKTDVDRLSASGRIEDPRWKLTRRADAYALNLREYWSHGVAVANDGYRYGNEGRGRELRDLNLAVKDLDRTLDVQLQKWQEVTSPYSDHYDVGQIYSAGEELLVTLRNASKDHAVRDLTEVTDRQQIAEAGFDLAIAAALAGLSRQIGDRLSAIGAGESVERVTMTSQTRETLDRAVTDLAAETMKSDAASAEAFRDDFIKNRWTGDRILEMQTTSRDLAEKLRANDLAPGEREKLEAQKGNVEETLQSLREAIDAVEKPRRQQEKIQDARDDLSVIDRELVTRIMTPERRAQLLTDRETKSKAVAELEEPFLSGALEVAKTWAADSQDTLDRYTERLDQARSEARTDPTTYWDKLRGQFLGEVEAAVSKDFRKELGGALDLADALKGWKKELAPKVALDPAKLQEAASNVLQTIEACSSRAQLALGHSVSDARVLAALRDELNAGLAAIRETVAHDLAFLFKSGVFGREMPA